MYRNFPDGQYNDPSINADTSNFDRDSGQYIVVEVPVEIEVPVEVETEVEVEVVLEEAATQVPVDIEFETTETVVTTSTAPGG